MPRHKTFYDYAMDGLKEHPEILEALPEFDRTGRLRKPNPKIRANFAIEAKLLRQLRAYCREHGLA